MLVTEPNPRLADIVRKAVAGGVDIVQWRDKTSPEHRRLLIAQQMRDVVAPPTLLIVNGDADLVDNVGAEGVNLPEVGSSIAHARSIMGTPALVGRSIHSIESARLAESEGADYVVAGTIFASASHPGQSSAGLSFLEHVCRSISIPVIAIGGITPETAVHCCRAGATGVAVLSPIMHSDNPLATASQFRSALDAYTI
jgi:thiamine-phosphate pyrophosphorylase